jgi:hypothetical protein
MTRPITQTILDTPTSREEGPPGNCLQAAVASYLELSLNEVPHFVLHDNWAHRLRVFAEERGFQLDCVKPDRRLSGIAIGSTERGTHHAVVWSKGITVWDPHPSRAGLSEVLWLFTLTPIRTREAA